MYNIHQYQSAVREEAHRLKDEEDYAKYLLRHEEMKEKAIERQKDRVQSFVQQQCQSPKHFVFQDDHYKHWRPLKQFRDVEDGKKFLDHKIFRHKPHYQMNRFFNQRERKQIAHLSMRKQPLVNAKIIPHEQRSRSLRSQGPLNPKIEFRNTKKDHEYLQPRLRFTNITDKERLQESVLTYDRKFQDLYQSFHLRKSQIGRTVVSPSKKGRYAQSAASSEDLYGPMAHSKPFYFEQEPQSPTLGVPRGELSPETNKSSNKDNPELCRISKDLSGKRKARTYFKLAKSMQIRGKGGKNQDAIEELMKSSQFERKKDLTNLKHNAHHENHVKRPIL